MSYLDKLRERRSTSKAIEQKLRLFVRLEDVCAILVVEGEEDSALYTNAFNTIVPNVPARVIICNGKGGVLGLRDFFYVHFSHDSKTMFFIDRDHDDFLGLRNGDDRTYVTDNYSIEWDVCTAQVLNSLVRRHYTLSDQDPAWSEVNAKFECLMQSWLEHATPFMCAVVYARRNGENPDLERVPLSEIFRFKDGDFISTGKRVEALLSLSGCDCNPNQGELERISADCTRYNERSYVRGKLVLQFFCEFFRNLSDICGNPEKIDGSALSTGVQIGKKTFIQFVLDDWQIPETLREFFERWKHRQLA